MKPLYTILSLVIGFAAFVPYFIGLWKKDLHPHLLTFLTWGILTGLGFLISLREGGGEGAWIFGLDMVLCSSVAIIVLFRREKNIVRLDWAFFFLACVLLVFYVLTRDVVLSIIFAGTIDLIGYLPSFRKDYSRPYDDPMLTYFLSFLGYLFSLGALGVYSFTTLFYPLTLMSANVAFFVFLWMRRKVIAK